MIFSARQHQLLLPFSGKTASDFGSQLH